MQREIPFEHSFPHPHPQLVAVKSLISYSSEIIIYSVSYAGWIHVLRFVRK